MRSSVQMAGSTREPSGMCATLLNRKMAASSDLKNSRAPAKKKFPAQADVSGSVTLVHPRQSVLHEDAGTHSLWVAGFGHDDDDDDPSERECDVYLEMLMYTRAAIQNAWCAGVCLGRR
jgi:hypothetical protein